MSITTTINAQVKAIVDDVRALPETIKKIDIADLQKQAEGLVQTAVGTATATYTDLTKRGEDVVSKAKGIKVEDIRKTVDHAADDAQKRAEQLVNAAYRRHLVRGECLPRSLVSVGFARSIVCHLGIGLAKTCPALARMSWLAHRRC